ncbi:MAG: tetratricopeptide repeat protein [Bacteroidaceae bacterium]|nr:tetratricopeptide repeat protein [Bacteroidaceae bacterium]
MKSEELNHLLPTPTEARKVLSPPIFIFLLLLTLGIRAQATFDYFYLEAEKCRLAEDYASAMDLYRHCLDINPEAPEALYNIGLLYLYLRSDSIGTEYIRRACERDANNPYYLETLGALYLGRRDAEAAIPVLEKMASLQTRRSDVLSQLVQLYSTVGDTDKAIGALDRIELLEGSSPQISIEKFRLYMEKEQKDSAFAQLQALCDESPHDMNLRVVVGSQYMQAGDTLKALEVYDEVRRQEPTNTNLQLATMDYLRDVGKDDRYNFVRDSLLYHPDSPAQLRLLLLKSYIADVQRDSTYAPQLTAAFDSLLSRPQQDPQVYIMKAAYQVFSKQPQEAVMQTMRQVLEVEPGNETALRELLQYYAEKNDDKGVEDISRRGLNYHPEEIAYAYYLGMALAEQKKLADAAEVLQQGLRVRTEFVSSYLVSNVFGVLGDIYYQQQKEQEAFAAYDSALVYKEDNIMCLNNYAYYLSLKNEQLDKAEEMSYRTIRQEPDNITYLDTYAWILFMKGDYEHSRSYMDKVVNPAKTDEELLADDILQGNIIEHAGDVYALCGDNETALRLWKLAEQKDDDTCTPLLRKKIKRKKYVK